jgi:acyl transferase domain-containing protein/phosphopantetheinyl transferase (holo-ACP synthase)
MSQSRDVAIIGVACTYPGARTAEQFWQNIAGKVDAIAPMPPRRIEPSFFDPTPGAEDKIYCQKGGFIGDSFAFNPLKYGTMPRALEGAEPDQFLVLRAVYEVMQDAGYLDADIDGSRVSFILGRGNYIGAGLTSLLQRGQLTQQTLEIIKGLHPEFTPAQIESIKAAIRRSLPGFSSETAAGIIPNIVSGRVANRLDFRGKNFTIDAACASSLIAAELGIEELLSGRNDMVIVGGVHIFTSVPFLQVFASMRALSPTETIRPFDADCDGTIAGEGVGLVALRRLADAEKAGDRIYAVIKGIGSSSDGRAKSVTAPRLEGEELALRRAYEACGLEPQSLGLIEVHGTGTPVGDQTEAEALRRVFGEASGPPSIAIGGVKSMIGHTMPAAGAAGLIKTALALYHRALPPTLNCRRPLPALVDNRSPFYVNSELRPWIQSPTRGPRRAGVNAFGFGGINAHVVLEEYTGDDPLRRPTFLREWDSELFVIQAESRPALQEQVGRLRQYVGDVRGVALRDVAWTLNRELRPGGSRLAIVANSFADLAQKLERAGARLAEAGRTQIKDAAGIYYFEDDEVRGGKVALLFPGEGAQYVNMLADLCLHFPEVRECFDSGDGVVQDRQSRYVASADIFPPPFFSEQEAKTADEKLWEIQRATEAVLTADGAMFTLLQRLGLQGDMMAGHSAGEWVALAASGILKIDEFLGSFDRLQLTYRQVTQDATIPSMVMLAVGAGRERVDALVSEIDTVVHVANDNCPHQVVVVAEPKDADRVVAHIQSKGVFVERLPYDRGYHTPAFTYICEPLRHYFAGLTIQPPERLVYCSTTAAPFPDDPSVILDDVSNTFARPLLFRQTIERMYEAGARIFVEVGPRGGLTAFVDDILRGKPHAAVATDQQRRPALTTLNNALGMLAALHVPLDLTALYTRRTPRTLTWNAASDRIEDPDAAPGTVQVPLWYPKLEPPPALVPASQPGMTTTNLEPGLREATSRDATLVMPTRHVQAPTAVSPAAPATTFVARGAEAPNGHTNGHRRAAGNGHSGNGLSTHAADAGIAPAGISSDLLPDSILSEHFAFMEGLLDTQEAVMQAYLTGRGEAVPGSYAGATLDMPLPLAELSEEPPRILSARGIETPARIEPVFVPPAPPPPELPPVEPVAASVAAASGRVPESEITAALLAIVSERTGYPTEMLGLDLDMEADLGIDSIKRVEILSALQQSDGAVHSLGGESAMEEVARLKTLRQVIDFILGASGTPALAAPPAAQASPDRPAGQPLLKNRVVVSHVEGQETLIHCRIDLAEHVYLFDHTFDTVGSDWDLERTGLPFVPMTVSLEMMAEVASTLSPGLKMIRARNVQALRWIEVDPDDEPVTLAFSAKRVAPDSIRVMGWRHRPEAKTSTRETLVEGTFVFGDTLPPAPAPSSLELVAGRAPSATPPGLYTNRQMFHGPRFQGIVAMDRIGENGLLAQLEVLRTDNVLASDSDPVFHTDPFLLDAAGQLVGYWPLEYCADGFVLFPIRIQELTLHRGVLPPGTRTTCQMRIANLSARQLRADMDVIAPDGGLWMRITGWEDWRFSWTQDFYQFWQFPNRRVNGTPVIFPVPPRGADVECLRVHSFGEMDKPMWENLWAHMVLSRREMAEYRGLSDRRARTRLLYRRAVAKDALRAWIVKNADRHLYPADIEIDGDDGQIAISGPALAVFPRPLYVSVSYDHPVAVAAAGPAPLGIELDAIVHWEGGVETARMSRSERGLLPADTAERRDEWLTRAWCAKKAAAKAFGTDADAAPADVTVAAIDEAGGILTVERNSAIELNGQTLKVSTVRDGDYIIALASLETR